MDVAQRQKWQQRLSSEAFLIGGWLRRSAVRALAHDGSPDSCRALAEVVTRGRDRGTCDRARAALERITDPRCIDVVCAVWVATRHEGLAQLLAERNWVPAAPEVVRVLTALKLGRLDVVANGGV